MASKLAGATAKTPKGFNKVLAVTIGHGIDQHGQNPTAAAVKAVANALEQTTLPAILHFVPDGFNGVKVKAKIATPYPSGVDVDEVKKAFPFGQPDIKVVRGGMRWHSGIVAPALGDPKKEVEAETSDDDDAEITSQDELMVAIAAIRVGY